MFYFHKIFSIQFIALTLFLFCTSTTIIQQGEGILEMQTSIEDRIALEEFDMVEAKLTIRNTSADTLFVPLLLKNDQPFFVIWQLADTNAPLYQSVAPDIATYGQGLSREHILQIDANSTHEFVCHIPIGNALLRSGRQIRRGTYSIKFMLENFYHGAKNPNYPMWFGRVESNVEVVEVY